MRKSDGCDQTELGHVGRGNGREGTKVQRAVTQWLEYIGYREEQPSPLDWRVQVRGGACHFRGPVTC